MDTERGSCIQCAHWFEWPDFNQCPNLTSYIFSHFFRSEDSFVSLNVGTALECTLLLAQGTVVSILPRECSFRKAFCSRPFSSPLSVSLSVHHLSVCVCIQTHTYMCVSADFFFLKIEGKLHCGALLFFFLKLYFLRLQCVFPKGRIFCLINTV